MKYEWRKKDKKLYLPKDNPIVIHVPKMSYFTIEGKGNPNGEDFKKCVEALYSLSYTIRMFPKKEIYPYGYYEYTVFPLEGVWDLDEEGRKLDYLDKDHLVYKLMIRQPDFVDDQLFNLAKELVLKKKKDSLIDEVKFEEIEEGLCLQMLHIGSFDTEPETFDIMEKYCAENNYIRESKIHKEVYISDPRKVDPEKLKTVLRFKIRE
ncbi:GyrI-like domain-containing protein [Romboutsia sp.]|uniref:GyrI-like domain-containing protein n=1 Tax=Romboutsia sp. TaxID=1965302 RepID=UPI003F2C4342